MEPSPYALQRARELTDAPLVLAQAAQLGASPEQVFAYVTDFERLPEWMPLMRRCRVDNSRAQRPGGVGAVRVIDSGIGKPAEETVIAFESPRLLAYRASDASLRGMFTQHLGVLTCEPHPQGGTWLTWLAHARPGSPPQGWLGPGVFKFVLGQSIAKLQRLFPVAA